MKKIILASASPRRKALLKQIGLDFVVMPSKTEENIPANMKPEEVVKNLALKKVKNIKNRVENAVVLGADTLVIHNKNILGKPSSFEEAAEMLRKLSGDVHDVITGIAIYDTRENREIVDAVTTRVFFKPLTEKEIERYIKTGEPMDKAGAYAIQGRGAVFVRKVEGCFFNVVGLPLEKVAGYLQQLGIVI